MNGRPVNCRRKLPPFLPEKNEESIEWNNIYKELKYCHCKDNDGDDGDDDDDDDDDDTTRLSAPQSSWAVVTGATRGIGRAIGEFDQSFYSCSNQIKSNQSTYYA